MVRTPRSIHDYDALFDPIRSRRQQASGKQLGDPDQAARAMPQVIESQAPPAHLLLGSDALALVRAKLAGLDDELARWGRRRARPVVDRGPDETSPAPEHASRRNPTPRAGVLVSPPHGGIRPMRHTYSIALCALLAAATVSSVAARGQEHAMSAAGRMSGEMSDEMAGALAAAPAIRAFDQAAFDAAQAAGKPILVWVHAPWCPVCRAQEKTISRMMADPAYRDLQVFRIDYDTQKPLWQRFGATMQSTLIGFHGKRETGRIAHETDDGKVSAVIRSTMG